MIERAGCGLNKIKKLISLISQKADKKSALRWENGN